MSFRLKFKIMSHNDIKNLNQGWRPGFRINEYESLLGNTAKMAPSTVSDQKSPVSPSSSFKDIYLSKLPPSAPDASFSKPNPILSRTPVSKS